LPDLVSVPTLRDLQAYASALEQERGFTGNSVVQQCLLLGEEVGELFKAVRKRQQMRLDAASSVGTVEGELADVLIYLCSIANRFDVDLEQALREKEEINKKRTWQ
jgi:NTP pyrophosphatase (non-canonical NTP hydrolase)